MSEKDKNKNEHVIDIDLPVRKINRQPKVENIFADIDNISDEGKEFFDYEIDSPFSNLFRFLEALPNKIMSQSSLGFEQMNIKEEPDEIKITVALPGFDKKDIHISAQGKILTLNAQKKDKNEIKRVSKQLNLGIEINPKKVRAEYKNGLLTIIIPKKTKTSGGFDIKIE